MKKDADFLKLLNHLSSFLMRTRMAIQELEFSVSEIIKSGRKEISPSKEVSPNKEIFKAWKRKWKHKSPKRWRSK